MTEKHQILGGKVHVYKRQRSAVWQCSTYIEGMNRRVSTKEDSLAKAKEFAEDWYLDLRGKKARGELVAETIFKQAAARFVKEYEVITAGERNEIYVRGHKVDLSRFDAAPLIAFTATKETYYGTETNGRIPARRGAHRADQWAYSQASG